MAVLTPEHDKAAERRTRLRTQEVGEFLAWLRDDGIVLARWPQDDRFHEATLIVCYESIHALLERYAGIDADKIEAEKQAMLAELRSGRSDHP